MLSFFLPPPLTPSKMIKPFLNIKNERERALLWINDIRHLLTQRLPSLLGACYSEYCTTERSVMIKCKERDEGGGAFCFSADGQNTTKQRGDASHLNSFTLLSTL